MATDLSARICENCANSSVCPHREVFLKFFENRDKILVGCGDENGNIDTSVTVKVRVEHRYMDGPGLEEVYRNLGLTGSGGSPCVSWGGACPILCHHPFDSPIYAPHPHAAGYIEPLCRGARDNNGNQIPFITPLATPRTNEVHAQPYPTYPGLNWWSCKSCANAGHCSAANGDYNKIGGTVFSTFGITYVDAKIGSEVNAADIETPKTIQANYRRLNNTPASFKISSEEDVIVIFYEHYEDVTVVDPYKWMTMDEIREKGLTHDVEIFYNDLSYIYPSFDGVSSVAMNVKLEGVICGSINRRNSDGSIEITTGQRVAIGYTNKISDALQTSKHEDLFTLSQEILGAYAGDIISVTDESMVSKDQTIDISVGNYRKLDMVEGDILVIGLYMPEEYTIDLNMMRMMNYGGDLSVSMAANSTGNGLRYIRLMVNIHSDDIVLQTCIVRKDYMDDEATYRPIDYLSTWDNHQIAWNMEKITAMNGKTPVIVYRPIAPRKWPAAYFNDKTPSYREDCPPSSAYIVRPFFDLIGYTTEASKRMTYDPSIQINPAFAYTYPRELRFLATREKTNKAVWAMWTIRHDMVNNFMLNALDLMNTNIEKNDSPNVMINLAKEIDSSSVEDRDLRVFDDVHCFSMNMDYTPNNAKTVYELFKTMVLPDNFIGKLYALPTGAKSVDMRSRYEIETIDHAPIGVVTYEDPDLGTLTMSLAECEVNEDTVEQFNPGLNQTYIFAVYPSNCAGVSVYCQNFVVYQFDVVQAVRKTTATFIMDGKDLSVNGGVSGVIMFDKMKAYELSNIYPEDAGKVFLKLDPDTSIISLGGERAKYYDLSSTCDLSYQQTLTVNCVYKDDTVMDQSSQYAVAYKGAYKLDFLAPEGDCIIGVNATSGNETKTLMWINDDKEIILENASFSNGTSIGITETKNVVTGQPLNQSGAYTLHFWDIAEDCVVNVIFMHGDNGTIYGCSRCRGYVDSSEYPYIEWVPVCSFFK